MAENTTEPGVHVTGEQRLHPALRKLGRACIALVRWQRGELEEATNAPKASPKPGQSPCVGKASIATAPEGETRGRP